MFEAFKMLSPEVRVSIVVSLMIVALIGYLLGSINFAIIFTNMFAKTDVRKHGSGNAGMTNVMRTAGKIPGILTFICDFLKGTIAVLIAMYFFDDICRFITELQGGNAGEWLPPRTVGTFTGIFCLLGHMYPVFFGFKGGKGVATMVGAAMAFSPVTALICFAVFLVITFTTKIVSISSIIAVTIAIPINYFLYMDNSQYVIFQDTQAIASTCLLAVMSALVIIKHHENIKRLINGTENKIGRKKKGN